MILSNRKLRLLIIALLLLIFSFFLGLIQPKAVVVSESMATNWYTNIDISGMYQNVDLYTLGNRNTPLFQNLGRGYVIFTIITTNIGSTSQLNVVEVSGSAGGGYVCDIGTATNYYDNQTSNTLYTAKCEVDFSSNTGMRYVILQRNSNGGTLRVNLSQFATFASDNSSATAIQNSIASIIQSQINNDNTNTQSIINSIDTNTRAIINAINSYNNQLSDIKSNSDNIKNDTSDIKNSINDSSIDSSGASSSASTWNSKNATNGTITNLLTLPITLLQAIVNGLQTSCSSFSLGSLFGTNITLPCINVGNLIGSGLWTTIDILFSGFMILAIAKKLIKIFNDFTNLKSNQIDELYGGGNK